MKRNILRNRTWFFLGLIGVSMHNVSAQCSTPGTLLTENYSSASGWTIVDGVGGATTATVCYPNGTSNGSVAIASNQFQFVTAHCSRPLRGYRSIPLLNNSGWTSEFTFTLNTPTGGGVQTNAPSAAIAAYTAGTQPVCTSINCPATFPGTCYGYAESLQDGIWVLLSSSNNADNCVSNTNQATWYFRLESKKGTSPVVASANIPLQSGMSTYYIRVQRTWTDWATLSVYSDAAHNNQVGSVCLQLDPTLTGLNTLQHGVWDAGSANRVLNASVSNMRIDNSVTCPRPLTASFTINSVFCQGESITADGTATTGSPQEIYHLWEITEYDDFGNLDPSKSWNKWYDGQAGPFTFPSVDEGGPDFITCNKHYRVTLAAQNCGNPWATSSQDIYISCPQIKIKKPSTVCEGSVVEVDASIENAHHYVWDPGNIITTTGSYSFLASGSTTYTVTGYDIYGCSSQAPITITVAPANIDINVSTGIADNTNTPIATVNYDDTWKLRGTPGNLSSSSYAALPYTRVQDPWGSWYTNSTAKWVSSTTSASGFPVNVIMSQSDVNIADNDYIFEYQFTLPANYSNLRLEVASLAVDNGISLKLNNNVEYSLPGLNTTNFENNHILGTIATNQAHYNNAGVNTIQAVINNGGGSDDGNGGPEDLSVMGLFMNGHIKGECVGPKSMFFEVIEPEESKPFVNDNAVQVYPNPSNGIFTVNSTSQILNRIVVSDMSGRMVKVISDLNGSNAELNLRDNENGVYFIKVWIKGNLTPQTKKIMIAK